MFVTAVDMVLYFHIFSCLLVGLVRTRLAGLCWAWSRLRDRLKETIDPLYSSNLVSIRSLHMRRHLIEIYVILILQDQYVLRFGDMKRDRTFRGESLCSVVWCLGEWTGSHRWKS